jgi:hypothetical protein
MKTIVYVCLMLIAFVFFVSCSGNNANIMNLLESESKATQQELIDTWSDYDIMYNSVVLVFDPKNDDKKILVDSYWSTVKDQETWTQLVNGTKTTRNGRINQVWGNGIREIWVSDDQFYGYVIHQRRELVSAQKVDENTVRLIHNYAVYGGP